MKNRINNIRTGTRMDPVQDAEIRRLLTVEKLSYTQAAERLGVTKGKIAGRAYKLGINKTGTKGSSHRKPHPWRKPYVPPSIPVVRQQSPNWGAQPVGREPCAAPDGCAAMALARYPYCAEHCSIFYTKGKGQ